MTHFDIVHTHFGTVHTLFTRYDTVHTHFDIVHIHFGTVHTVFKSYDTVHKNSRTLWLSSNTHCSQAKTRFTHTLT